MKVKALSESPEQIITLNLHLLVKRIFAIEDVIVFVLHVDQHPTSIFVRKLITF